MTIGYTTHWPKSMGVEYAGKPTFFPQKIIKGLSLEKWSKSAAYSVVNDLKSKTCGYVRDYDNLNPKLTTLREDPKDLWKVGMKIHPVINNRTKYRFQFAPALEVKGIQKIVIKHWADCVQVIIDCSTSFYWKGDEQDFIDPKIQKLSKNDGFDNVEQFFGWFNKDFKGKIIHWTKLKY